MNNRAGHRVQSRSAVFFGSTDAQEAKFTHATKQFKVEFLVAVVLKRLRFHMLLGPFSHHLTKHRVLFAGVGDVHVGHALPSLRWLLTFGAGSAYSRNIPSKSKGQILSFNEKFKRQIEQTFAVDNSIPSTMSMTFQRHKFVVNVQ